MPAPICPFLTPVIHRRQWGQAGTQESPEHQRCKGSSCVCWVPEMSNGTAHHGLLGIGDDDLTETGRGWCCRNFNRQPHDDPRGGKL